jgi:NAD-dependent deacetylase
VPDLPEAARFLAQAPRVLILTGAGISAESGVPTFRDAGGLWQNYRPEDLATPEAFARDPRLVWAWYGWRRSTVARCDPNEGHLALARWMLRRDGTTLVTQNVDALHERAAQRVGGDRAHRALPVRLHGSIARVRCGECAYAADDSSDIDATSLATLPHCPQCRALLRPDVVWFGESLPETAIGEATRAARSAEACLVVGTAGAVYPAAGFAQLVAQRGGALIVVDPEATAFDAMATVKLVGKAGEILPALLGAAPRHPE